MKSNEVRVLRIKYGPGEKSVMHFHKDHKVINASEYLTRVE
jgi:hypothetical protein